MSTWGALLETGDTSYSLTNRAIAGTGQFNGDDQQVISIHGYFGSATAVDIRAALYVSDTADPEGATLVVDAGIQEHTGNFAWTTWTLASRVVLASGKYYHIAFKTDAAGVNIKAEYTPAEDLTKLSRWTDTELSGGVDDTVPWSDDDPLPAINGTLAWEPAFYLTLGDDFEGIVRPNTPVANVVRVDDYTVRVYWPETASYDITADETISFTSPPGAIAQTDEVVIADDTWLITYVAPAAGGGFFARRYYDQFLGAN